MKKLVIVSGLLSLYLCGSAAYAQSVINRNRDIAGMVESISADSLHSYVNTLAGFGSRHTHSSLRPQDGQIGAAQQWLQKKFKSLNSGLQVSVDSYTLPPTKRVPTVREYRNVVAVLPGSDPSDNRLFIMSGHLDSRAADGNDPGVYSPGANDDGSAIAAMLEISRVLGGRRFPATVMFVAFSGEEVGLRGSGAMADKAKEEGWNIGALLNNDMIGQSNSNGTNLRDNTRVRVFSQGVPGSESGQEKSRRILNASENDGIQRQLARYIEETGEKYVDNLDVVMIYRNDRFGRGGDHTPFVNWGYPAVRITEMNENFNRQHKDISEDTRDTYGDIPEAMDFEYLRKNAAMNLAVISSLASAPSAPERVSVNLSNADNHTQLKWDEPLYGKAAGYYVVMRETTAAQWQKKFYTADRSMVLPYSRDNYIFGVQAVGANGCESVVTVATAGGR